MIAEITATGRWSQLERLRGELAPEILFRTIPGIGTQLARRLAEDGQLETLEDLENALQHRELVNKGFGKRRQAMLATMLAEKLGRSVFARRMEKAPSPPISLLLQVDSIYHEKAAAGQLRIIAPKRASILRKKHGCQFSMLATANGISRLCILTRSWHTSWARPATG